MAELHTNDTGASIICLIREGTAALNIATATCMYIHYQKPDTTTGSWSASLSTDGTDGKMSYVTGSADLDTAGWWSVQPAFTLDTWTGRAETKEFEVLENL